MHRIHIAITTHDLAAALPFYETLFGCPPAKVRDDYAKFEVAEPAVNFTLNRVASDEPAGHRSAQHFGIQVGSTDAVHAAQRRLEAAGLAAAPEEQVTCCYALSDKVWATDPDGHRWEIFVTHADADVYAKRFGAAEAAETAVEATSEEAPCCAPSCCQ